MSFWARILRALGRGPVPPAEGVEEFFRALHGAAGELRAASGAAALEHRRTEVLGDEARDWNRRLRVASGAADPEVAASAARVAARVDIELAEARGRLVAYLESERDLRDIVARESGRARRILRTCQASGIDVAGLAVPVVERATPPVDPELPDDDDREYLARLIDGIQASAS